MDRLIALLDHLPLPENDSVARHSRVDTFNGILRAQLANLRNAAERNRKGWIPVIRGGDQHAIGDRQPDHVGGAAADAGLGIEGGVEIGVDGHVQLVFGEEIDRCRPFGFPFRIFEILIAPVRIKAQPLLLRIDSQDADLLERGIAFSFSEINPGKERAPVRSALVNIG